MVDFKEVKKVTQTASELMRLELLESRYNCLEALESFTKLSGQNADCSYELEIFKARLFNYWSEVRCMAKRNLKPEEVNNLIRKLRSDKIQDLIFVIEALDDLLDKNNLTRLDIIKIQEYSLMEGRLE